MTYLKDIPEFAIIDPNTFSCIGLKSLLETIFPKVIVRCFNTFEMLIDDTPDMYIHYFVSSSVVLEHTSFFLERKHKTIVLVNGENNASFNNFHTLNINLPEHKLASALIQLHEHAHGRKKTYKTIRKKENFPLSKREVEVLVLIVHGLINKEIANRLNISLTTVISHRKNITEKLGIRSISGLTVYAIINGLVEANQI
ncbi:MAG: helix-turn-helix transcriptional regulator [Bacteroidaceae bacterium]|nr:helix-turn-helix transcriptional regulator [Bacteroidaceae bacterium]